MFPDPAIAQMLARWHGWRRAYSHERGLVKVQAYAHDHDDDDDRLEAMQMQALEQVIESMPPDWRLALQHVARAEFLGAEVIMSMRLGDATSRERLISNALRELEARLRRESLL